MSARTGTAGPTIQSLSIPSHTIVSSPTPPYITYTVRISTPSSTYSVPHRYSDFATLHSQLPTPVPVQLPPKRNGWLPSFRKDLSEQEVLERRLGLEKYLRTLLTHKDTRWSTSTPFRDFLAPPALSSSAAAALPQQFTSSTWLTEHSSLQALSKTLKASFAKRDSLILARSAEAHSLNLEAKRSLVELVKRLEGLKAGLDGLAKGGMVQGELERRRDMLGALEDERDALGRTANNPPKAPLNNSRSTANNATTSSSRAALLPSGPPTTRAFGASATEPKETAETRPLDNHSLMALQDEYVTSQDSKLEELTRILRRQGEIGGLIGKELAEQDEVLDALDKGVGRVTDGMKKAEGKMKRLGS